MDRLAANTACDFITKVYKYIYSLQYGISCGDCSYLDAYGRYKSVLSDCTYNCVEVTEYEPCGPQVLNCAFVLTPVVNPDSCGVFILTN